MKINEEAWKLCMGSILILAILGVAVQVFLYITGGG